MGRKCQQKGTVLIMVLMLSTCIMLVATVALRSSTLFYELALDRMMQVKQQRAAQALAYYGIAYCKQMKNHNVPQILSFDCWPPEGPYEGKIEIAQARKGYTIEATMSKNGQNIHTIQIEIAKEKDGWRIGNHEAI